MLLRTTAAAVGVAIILVTGVDGARLEKPQSGAIPDILSKSIALYPTLTSYSDTATVTKEVAGITEKSRFTTRVRIKPTRDLYFDYEGISEFFPALKVTNDRKAHRYVVWMRNGEMQTYNARTKGHEQVSPDGGGQVNALRGLGPSTEGTSMLILGLIYSKANMPTTILQIEEASLEGVETVGTRPCHKVVGVAAAYYPSGARTQVRPVTVWIDTETHLIRQVFEDTPKGYGAGSFLRLTVTLEPQANPVLDEKLFQFTVPSGH